MVSPLGNVESGQPYLLTLLAHRLQAGWQRPSDPNWSKPTPLPSALGIAPFYLLGPCQTLSAFWGTGVGCQSYCGYLPEFLCHSRLSSMALSPQTLYNVSSAHSLYNVSSALTRTLAGHHHCLIVASFSLIPPPPALFPLPIPSTCGAELCSLALTSDPCVPEEWG